MIKSLTIWRNFTFMFHGQQTSEISRTFLSATLGINYYKGILKPSSFAFLSLHQRAIVQWKFLTLPFLSTVLPCSFDFRNLLLVKYKQKVQISVILLYIHTTGSYDCATERKEKS